MDPKNPQHNPFFLTKGPKSAASDFTMFGTGTKSEKKSEPSSRDRSPVRAKEPTREQVEQLKQNMKTNRVQLSRQDNDGYDTARNSRSQTPVNDQMVIQDEPPVAEENPDEFLDNLYRNNNTSSNKKSKKTTNNENRNVEIIHNIGEDYSVWKGQNTSYDTTHIRNNGDVRNKTTTKPTFHGHMLIYISSLDKYYCTHCCATIESRLLSDHITKCYFTSPIDKAHYCSICNSRNTAETAPVHFNSAKHMNRFNYINELVKMPYIYVNAAGSSHVKGSKQQEDDGAHAISTAYLVSRLSQAAAVQTRYALSGGKQLFRLMAQIISNRETGSDDVGSNLVQRNAVIKCFNFFKSEVNGRKRLCHVKNAFDTTDFITVANCAEALKEINYDIIDKQPGDLAQKLQKKEKIDKIFAVAPNGAAECNICKLVHDNYYYMQPASIIKVIDMVLSQLTQEKKDE